MKVTIIQQEMFINSIQSIAVDVFPNLNIYAITFGLEDFSLRNFGSVFGGYSTIFCGRKSNVSNVTRKIRNVTRTI